MAQFKLKLGNKSDIDLRSVLYFEALTDNDYSRLAAGSLTASAGHVGHGQNRRQKTPLRPRMPTSRNSAPSKKASDIGGLFACVSAALLLRPAAAQSLRR